jgi:hypothetical protein
VAAFYYLITKGNLLLYYFTASIGVVITGIIIYLLAYKTTRSLLLSASTTSLYLFSFMILATSDHQSGVFLAALFSVLSFFFFTNKKFFIAGIFAALALLTKAYTLPLLVAMLFVLIIENRKSFPRYIGGCITAVIIILLPTILSGPASMWHDVFAYSLTRSQGVSKLEILWFSFQHDFLFILLLTSSAFFIKKYRFYGILALISILFFILYKDIYYLYLVVTIPFLCLFFAELMKDLLRKYAVHPMMIPTIIVIFLGYNFISYFNGYNRLQLLNQLPEMLQIISKEKPKVLYGVNGITPALAYLSNTPLLNNIIDTNDNIFRKGYLDAKNLTRDAINQHALIVTQGVWYPEVGIKEDILTDVVVKETIKKHCKLTNHFDFNSEGNTNIIAFYRC